MFYPVEIGNHGASTTMEREHLQHFTTFETDCDSINPPADGMMALIEFHPVGIV